VSILVHKKNPKTFEIAGIRMPCNKTKYVVHVLVDIDGLPQKVFYTLSC